MIKYSLILLLFIVSVLTLVSGPTPLMSAWEPILHERLPRLIVLLSTGASLAVAGAVMQALFQNPLAAPSILGISAGGSLMVIFVFLMGLQGAFIPFSAFCGCLLTLMLVYALSRKNGQVHMHNLILTGIAISTLLLAIQSAILFALRDQWQLIQTLTELEAGSSADRSWRHVHMQLPLTLVGLWGCYTYRRALNILSLGDDEANNLGVDVSRVRWRLFLCISLLTGGAIASIGTIAFFGLIFPHLLRKATSPNNETLIPLCILGGAVALPALDLTLRIFSLHDFTLGNLSAVMGAFIFILLLNRSQRWVQA